MSHVVGTVNIVSVMAMAPVISRDLDLSAAQFGAFVSAYYAAQACGSMPAGAITDRYGVGRTLLLAHVIMFAAAVSLAIADGYIQCLAAMFLMGIGYSMNNPSTARGVLDWCHRGGQRRTCRERRLATHHVGHSGDHRCERFVLHRVDSLPCAASAGSA